jgi:GTPase
MQESLGQRAVIVGIVTHDERVEEVDASLNELSQLLDTLDIQTVSRLIQYKPPLRSAYKIGKGKLQELKALVGTTEADLVVFDSELTPTQSRNIQKEFKELKTWITDRTGIILDIFWDHAKTHEAKLQIELAQLQYSYSHLKRKWTHLHRQRGGYGSSFGEGETQLEVDRRMNQAKISLVKAKLLKIQKQRTVQKNRRHRFFKVAIVGYTNSGKSTLLNALTESSVRVENKLFATLDPTTRIIKPDEKPAILFSDTVGFIHKLPHHLVASFRSTFEEIKDADLLLHIVDIADERHEKKIEDTGEVLRELGLDSIPRLLVFNKLDLVGEEQSLKKKLLQAIQPQAIFVSAWKNLGLAVLKQSIYAFFQDQMLETTIKISFGVESILEELYEYTRVMEASYDEESITLHFRGATRDVNYLLGQFRLKNALIEERE